MELERHRAVLEHIVVCFILSQPFDSLAVSGPVLVKLDRLFIDQLGRALGRFCL